VALESGSAALVDSLEEEVGFSFEEACGNQMRLWFLKYSFWHSHEQYSVIWHSAALEKLWQLGLKLPIRGLASIVPDIFLNIEYLQDRFL
jgi:hypothetical protein